MRNSHGSHSGNAKHHGKSGGSRVAVAASAAVVAVVVVVVTIVVVAECEGSRTIPKPKYLTSRYLRTLRFGAWGWRGLLHPRLRKTSRILEGSDRRTAS